MLTHLLRLVVLLTLVLAPGCRVAGPPPDAVEGAAERVPATWPFALDAPAVSAPSGMVVTDEARATAVGAAVLMRGGNAVDAAVATAFALAVVYPEAGNMGGGGFLVAHVGDTTVALDFRETAPAAATRDMYLDATGEPTDASVVGHRAAGVPGTVAGLYAAWERFGTLPWAELVQPAVTLAEQGFTVNARFAETVRRAADELRRFPASRALFLPDGEALDEGTTWRNPDLAATLRRIAQQGPSGFYEGETADLIAQEMERGGGLITQDDLRAYRAVWREPVAFDYRGHRVVSMPPPSSGGITLALMANLLDEHDLRRIGWHTPAALHLTTEAMRRAFAVRNHYLGDPDFIAIPHGRLLSDPYADSLGASIVPEQATPSRSVTPGTGDDGQASYHTTHFSVADVHGNAVSLTTTINFLYGSKVTVAGAGFLLNNEMNDFAAKPGTPNAFGLVQSEANAIAPGKRMLSSMSPTIVLDRDGQPLLITGARGGPRIITSVFHVLSNVLDHGFGVAAAVNAPRIHHQHLPDVLYYEGDGLSAGAAATLRGWGHDLNARDEIANAPSILRRGDVWTGAGDPRNEGVAAGY